MAAGIPPRPLGPARSTSSLRSYTSSSGHTFRSSSRSVSSLRSNTNFSGDTWWSSASPYKAPIEIGLARTHPIAGLLCLPVTRCRFELRDTWGIPEQPFAVSAGVDARPLPAVGEDGDGADALLVLTQGRSNSSLSLSSPGPDGEFTVPHEAARKKTGATADFRSVLRNLNQSLEPTTELRRKRPRRLSLPQFDSATILRESFDKMGEEHEEDQDGCLRRVKSWPEFGVTSGCLDALLAEPTSSFFNSEPSMKALSSTKKSATQLDLGQKMKKPKVRTSQDNYFNLFRFRFLRSMSMASESSGVHRLLRRAGTAISSLSSTSIKAFFWWNEKTTDFFSQDGGPISCRSAWALLILTLVLSALVMLLLSDIIGFSVHVYLLLIHAEILSKPLLGAGGVGSIALHIMDVYSWTGRGKKRWQLLAMASMFYLVCFGILFMTKSYPEIPLIVVLVHFPLWIGGIRVASVGHWASYSFHMVVSRSCLLSCIVIATVWSILLAMDGNWSGLTEKRLQEDMNQIFKAYGIVNWELCRLEKTKSVQDADSLLLEDCNRIELCAFLTWTCPAIESAVLMSIAVFLGLRCSQLKVKTRDDEAEASASRSESTSCKSQTSSSVEREDKSLNRIMFSIFVIIGFAWSACAIAGSSMGMGNTVLLALGCTCILFFIWLIGSIRLADLAIAVHQSLLWKVFRPFVKSDWAKAMVLCCTNVFVAAFLVLEFFTRLFERLCGMKPGPLKYTTERGAWLLKKVSTWPLTSVLTKAWWLSMLFLLLWVVCTKVSLVLLSWLIDYSTEFHPLSVLGLFYIVGLSLFLCPTMPVVPIYMSAGILIVARLRDEMGFFWAFITACMLCLALKLNACAMQQKLFGQVLGRYKSVKRLVGVHTVATRAVEHILRQPGLTVAKVAILVGGPDWPTSVLTGIMGLNLWQMLFGTLPVFFLILPTVFAGSCLLDEDLRKFSTLVLGVMGVAHGSSFITALVMSARVATKHHGELKKPRPEHKDLEDMAQRVTMQANARRTLTTWSVLRSTQRISLSLALAVVFACVWITTLLSSRCFRPFGLDSDISVSFKEGGLEGNAWNLLKPLGKISSGLLIVGILLFTWYSVESACREHMVGVDSVASHEKQRDADGEAPPAPAPQLALSVDTKTVRSADSGLEEFPSEATGIVNNDRSPRVTKPSTPRTPPWRSTPPVSPRAPHSPRTPLSSGTPLGVSEDRI